MQIGVVLPTYEIPADAAAVAEYAQAAEQLGYAHLAVMDHVAGASLTSRPDWAERQTLVAFHEPFVVMGYLAAVTKSIELISDVLVAPLRQTVLLAKQAAEADVLCGGRLRLGVGVGWAEPEFQALNENFHTRGRRLDEQIAVLRALFTQDAVTFEGRWHHLDAVGISPRPIQRPIPIWVGGDSEAALRRAATLGDGWLPLMAPDAKAQAAIERLREYARFAGRDPQSIGIQAALEIGDTTPDDWRRVVAAWEELGAAHFTLYPLDAGHTTLAAHLDLLERFKDAVGFRAAD